MNTNFEDFFKHYGFIPRLCRPYRPQTKGKIENRVGFVKRDFLMGSEFHSFSDLNHQAQIWLARINSTVHSTTNEIPLERLNKKGLKNCDSVPAYHNIQTESRKISRDSYISYLGNRYSVPYRFAGRNCSLQISDRTIAVVVDKDVICTHEIRQGHCKISRNKEHFKGLLSEILKQNSNPRARHSLSFRFIEPEVEQRSLSIYDFFSEGVRK
ncbi:Integrase core domain protein [uncultured archaeon]|nr:Integrase core domain protein [uncultured archaeon]